MTVAELHKELSDLIEQGHADTRVIANCSFTIKKGNGEYSDFPLLYTIYGEGGSPVVAHFAYRDKQELMNVWTGAILTEDKVIAWKEIVLPKE